jgi:hypothetical protein
MLESVFQGDLIKEIERRFPGCMILKNDPNYRQGVPDLVILFEDKWAMLEVKASEDARSQPNQQYYVDMLDVMSFSAFVYPENVEDVLSELEQTFRPRRSSRASEPKQSIVAQLRPR